MSRKENGTVEAIDLSKYQPTPEQRRFSISTFAITGQIAWEAKPGGEFMAGLSILKGALARMIPFQTMAASTYITTTSPGESTGTQSPLTKKTFRLETDGKSKERTWDDISVLSPIEIPWVIEYAFQRWSVGGPSEVWFPFEDGQRQREAIVSFYEEGHGEGFGLLRVLKPDEERRSISGERSGASQRAGDTTVVFDRSTDRPKIMAFTVSVPIVGQLRFVAT
jgi:hypothetical protein